MQDAKVLLELLDQNSLDEALSLVLFKTLDKCIKPQEPIGVFHQLATTRLDQLKALSPWECSNNLDYLFNSPSYKNLIFSEDQPTSLDELSKIIELLGYKHFGSVLELWAQYEAYKITGQASITEYKMPMSRNDEEYDSRLVEDILEAREKVMSPFCHKPLSVSQAVLLSNIAVFVVEQRWFEMLFSLALSTKGQHFILTLQQEDTPPLLVSSALIHDWSKKDQWLSLTPFFQHDCWKFTLNPSSYHHMLNTGAVPDLDLTSMQTLKQFDTHCWPNMIQPSTACEILRLTTAGKQIHRMYILYLAQKMMAKALFSAGYRVALTIIDQPWLLLFYRGLREGAYVELAQFSVNDAHQTTHRGAWLVEEFYRQYQDYSFDTYRLCVNQQKNIPAA